MRIENKLAFYGMEVTQSPEITKSYVTSTLDKYHIYVSGIHVQCPSHLLYEGHRIGKQLSVEWLKACARRSMVNQISMMKRIVEDLDAIDQLIKVVYYINGIGTKEEWNEVTCDTTAIVRDVFGEAGKDCEVCTIAPVPLPPGQPVQIDLLASLPSSILPGRSGIYEGIRSGV
ncbi:hypothetical protein JQN58_16425 [Aneurinibacillus sp. BA2021]|nr:hypothetical protein [Aneurinibacillus sp. BA2021]